jgi:DNA invertase Pin-like site-specific DNA recombinase
MVLTVFAGSAEFERHLIRSRTEDGRRAALAFGRPRKMSNRQAMLARELVHDNESISEVARAFNVHPATIYRCLEDERGL